MFQSFNHAAGGLREVQLCCLDTSGPGGVVFIEWVLLRSKAAAPMDLGGTVSSALALGAAMAQADLVLLLSNEVI